VNLGYESLWQVADSNDFVPVLPCLAVYVAGVGVPMARLQTL